MADFDYQASAPGTIVQLSHGKGHYQQWGSTTFTVETKFVVCVHGFSTESAIYEPLWGPQSNTLAQDNVAIFAIDLYGRGYTDALDSNQAYTLSMFHGCLSEFLLHIDMSASGMLCHNGITLVGYSMGGAIVANAVLPLGSLIKAAVLIAPSGLPVTLPLVARLARSKWLGGLLFPLAAQSSMDQHVSEGYHAPDCEGVPEHIAATRQRLKQQFEHHAGFGAALLSTLQHFPFGGLQPVYTKLGNALAQNSISPTVEVIWGQNDKTVPFTQRPLMQQLLPTARFTDLPNSGHSDPFAVPAQMVLVCQRILELTMQT